MSALFPRFVEGYMPMQMLVEVGLQILLFIYIFYLLDKKMGIKVNKLVQASSLFIYSILYFRYRINPPLPFSVLAIYATNVLIGIFMWVSSTETSWQDSASPSSLLPIRRLRPLGSSEPFPLWCCPSS